MTTGRGRLAYRASVVVALVALLGTGLVRSEEQNAAEKARLKKLDAGPKVIDVSKYPAEQKATYPLFSKKCSKCHNLARAINTNFVLPGEWERYIKRMLYKPDSKLSEDDAKAIYRFLTYDSSVRKADSLHVHLERLQPDERATALSKIHAVNPSFEGTTSE